MEVPSNLDLAAAARIAKRAELQEIKLSEISASRLIAQRGALRPEVQHKCSPGPRQGNRLDVVCSYTFKVKDEEEEVANADFKYLVSYALSGDDPIDADDLEHFAFANGTYHSWPFVRQLIFDLTARMGYPPYTLPVFQFNPKPKLTEPAQTLDDGKQSD